MNFQEFLNANGFTKLNKYATSNGDIAVASRWDDEFIITNGTEVTLVSANESELIEAVKALLIARDGVESNEATEAQDIAKLVAQDSDMKYYADENARGQNILIKDVLAKIGKEIPKSVAFGDFKKLVESV